MSARIVTLFKSLVILPAFFLHGQDLSLNESINIGSHLHSRGKPGVGSVTSLDAVPEVPSS
jgi:hypothetical protein